jgi:hypothetical protein
MKIDKQNMEHDLEGTVEITAITSGHKELYTFIKLKEYSDSYLIDGQVRLNPGEKVRLYFCNKEESNLATALEVLDKKGKPSFIYTACITDIIDE